MQIAFHALTSTSEDGLVLLALLTRGEEGDLENVMVRLSVMACSPAPAVSEVASDVLAAVQSILQGPKPDQISWEKPKSSVQAGTVWTI